MKLIFPYGSGQVLSIFPVVGCETASSLPYKVDSNLSETHVSRIKILVDKFPDTVTKGLGLPDLVTYDIKLKSNTVVKSRPYQLAPPKLAVLREHTDKLLEEGVFRPSISPSASPAFLVP